MLRLTEVATPELGPGEVLIRVTAAGVNRADLLQRQGFYPPPPGISDIIGLEVSGHIAALGEGVDSWTIDAPCVALLAGGGYAEYVAVPAGQVVEPPPEYLAEPRVALAGGEDGKPGEVFLVHGGAGGIGTFAIQYARALGATVIATAGTPEKRALCRELGADVALDYHDDWAGGVRAATGGHGADVILDVMGAKYLEANVATLAADGRLVVIGLQGGRKGTLDLNALLVKRGTVTATSLRGRPAAQKAAICAQVRDRVWPMLADGRIRPLPETRFPIADVAEAHRRLASGENTGKVLLIW